MMEEFKTQARALWTGKPWILPNVLTRTALVIGAAIGVFWFEYHFDLTFRALLTMPIIAWTGLILFLVWLLSLPRLLALRASNTYILRNDGIEVRNGILTSKSFVISPAGFSDLEVTRSVAARIVNSGDIIIRTQGENDVRMEKVRNPLKVANKIREVMARPTVRIEGPKVVNEYME
ncbi:PH domain-containing protein [Candidatus Bathyarchaeota archaeon]|nr:PH domain-containing protein [Candidatus Bathyarchaeota archaeon]